MERISSCHHNPAANHGGQLETRGHAFITFVHNLYINKHQKLIQKLFAIYLILDLLVCLMIVASLRWLYWTATSWGDTPLHLLIITNINYQHSISLYCSEKRQKSPPYFYYDLCPPVEVCPHAGEGGNYLSVAPLGCSEQRAEPGIQHVIGGGYTL